MELIRNTERLIAQLGAWPDFHDAEVLAARLDCGQGSGGRPSLELDIHVFTVAQGGGEQSAGYAFENHTLVTLRFEEIDALELEDFGPQNVLFSLDVQRDSTGRLTVDLPSSNGMTAVFTAASASVAAAEPFTPGPHSVYGR